MKRTLPAYAGCAVVFAAVLGLAGCRPDSSRLTTEWERRFATEGRLRHAPNVIVRHTREVGPYGNEYRDRVASVVITKGTVLIHQNDRALLELTARTRRHVRVVRDRDRIRISVDGKRVTEVFSFRPPEDAAGWVEDVRAVSRLAGRAARSEAG
jgi:hypothetical protein